MAKFLLAKSCPISVIQMHLIKWHMPDEVYALAALQIQGSDRKKKYRVNKRLKRAAKAFASDRAKKKSTKRKANSQDFGI